MLLPKRNTQFAHANTTGPLPTESAGSSKVVKTGSAGSIAGIHIPPTSLAGGTASQGLITVKQGDVGVACKGSSKPELTSLSSASPENVEHDRTPLHRLWDILRCNAPKGESFTREQEVTADQFKALLACKTFSDDVHYRIRGDLQIVNDSHLKNMPKNVTVEGNLEIINCPVLKYLTENLSVEGSVDFSDCTALKRIPNSLSCVKGDFKLTRCTAIEELPRNLSVTGNFYLNAEPNNKGKNRHLWKDQGDEIVSKWRKTIPVEHMPETLIVGGDARLIGCDRVQVWPKKFSVGGDLDLERSSVKGLDNFSAGKSIIFRKTDLVKLPSCVRTVNGTLDVSNTPLEELPSGLYVDHFLQIYSCPKLKKRPKNMIKIDTRAGREETWRVLKTQAGASSGILGMNFNDTVIAGGISDDSEVIWQVG